MKTKSNLRFAKMPGNYAGLCQILLPRPIHTETDYEETSEIAEAMAVHAEDFSRDQRDYFELLCSLIEEFDAKRVKWPKVRGIDALKHLLSEQSLAGADLSRLLGGSRNLGGMILRGERKLTLNHVRRLSRRFGVSADLFLE